MKRGNKIYQLKKQEIFQALHRECQRRSLIAGVGEALPEPEYWPKTRDLANCCGESIYTTRSILLKLVEEGKVLKLVRAQPNTLRWYVNQSWISCNQRSN